MPKDSSNFRQELSKIIENYRKIKHELNGLQRKYIEERIKVFKTILKNPNTDYYFDENDEIQLGKIIWDNCRYCNEKLDEIRNGQYPKLTRNVERFCSKSCIIQYSKKKKEINNYGADNIIWGKDFVKLYFQQKCDNPNRKKPHEPFIIELPTRITRAKNFRVKPLNAILKFK